MSLHNIGRIGPFPSAPSYTHAVVSYSNVELRFIAEETSTCVPNAGADIMGFCNA